ncbi:uncharacterized protein LOC119766227 [Culex quinquefasciatus]|uniref:uncharacterized protein LOC119766227 n=1 Tax=Culex quinquefasciatus TaxID=7176 RepID=UPI0018E36E7C|nr:uncharacterized protein LOC119766227 [Culex quinquefasciatus]
MAAFTEKVVLKWLKVQKKRPGSSHSLLDTDHGTEMWANSLDKAWLRLMAALANENMILQHTETVITRTERESPGRAATSDAKSIIDGLEDLITTTVKTSSVKIGIVELKLLFGKFKSFYCYATFDMV